MWNIRSNKSQVRCLNGRKWYRCDLFGRTCGKISWIRHNGHLRKPLSLVIFSWIPYVWHIRSNYSHVIYSSKFITCAITCATYSVVNVKYTVRFIMCDMFGRICHRWDFFGRIWTPGLWFLCPSRCLMVLCIFVQLHSYLKPFQVTEPTQVYVRKHYFHCSKGP